jgi:hypothetical protein
MFHKLTACLQSEDDARDRRGSRRSLRGSHAGAADRCELLHSPHPAQAGGTSKVRLGQAGARHARRCLYQDASSNRAILSDQAPARSGRARIQGTLIPHPNIWLPGAATLGCRTAARAVT